MKRCDVLPSDERPPVGADRSVQTQGGANREIEADKDDRQWDIGPQLRSKGSIHSDTWTGSAVELARCGVLAVYPVSGWWRERKHLDCWRRKARYSLIVTIETPETDVYTPIANQIGIPAPVEIETQ